MEENKQRTYEKESTKTSPVGIRFDKEKLELVKIREKLNTNQKVVDFLLNKYWWELKLPIPTHKDVPPIYDSKEIGNTLDEPKQYIIPEKASVIQKVGKPVEVHYKEIKNLETPYEYEQKTKEINEDESLTSKERTELLLFIKLPKGQ